MDRLFLILQLALNLALLVLASAGAIAQITLGLTDNVIGYTFWAALIAAIAFLFVKSCRELKQDMKE